MDAAQLFQGISQLGLGGIAIFLWYMDSKKITGLEDIVKEQIEEKKIMRDERIQLVALVKECTQALQRCATAMEALDSRNRVQFGKRPQRV